MSIARSSSASTLAPNGSVPGSSRTPEARGRDDGAEAEVGDEVRRWSWLWLWLR
ncbi:hypothetical protein PV733_15295 [Streptomyces europaeiscabiei]|uniref:Uncharacterized protein n=1 Tax=Streptomyces europaeiscabiei TaxID=146819 RepID=A0ABU4NWE5_9ACTN|nr:hypothetical protein [Streptomyces europaeiscabiei]MDX3549669.1 hypothetical protein [Streptomyces europaeiscabiei]MDX3558956.1 hypothetical protein [Streptomyces europaeiscabiei]MDX3707004.1 hypothetical protein [Streptomyces europaeiscabiei]MDX3710303.1 hypothetical protein [Streptomyces europaeiscabiei]